MPKFVTRDKALHLTILQVRQHDRGRRSAVLVKTLRFGWAVCHASNLDNCAVIFSGKDMGREIPQEEAIAFGVAWANEDPKNREFFARKVDIQRGKTRREENT
jgi:hypothetical protein